MRSLQTEAESIRISANGSDSRPAARWRADGKELFYLAPDQTIVAVPIEKGSTDAIGRAQSLFTIGRNSGARSFDVTPDGQRFLITSPAPRIDSSMIAVVLNWPTSLKK
jgi:eukaryotic-like serine/threonine-protein kinase